MVNHVVTKVWIVAYPWILNWIPPCYTQLCWKQCYYSPRMSDRENWAFLLCLENAYIFNVIVWENSRLVFTRRLKNGMVHTHTSILTFRCFWVHELCVWENWCLFDFYSKLEVDPGSLYEAIQSLRWVMLWWSAYSLHREYSEKQRCCLNYGLIRWS